MTHAVDVVDSMKHVVATSKSTRIVFLDSMFNILLQHSLFFSSSRYIPYFIARFFVYYKAWCFEVCFVVDDSSS